MRMCIVQPAQAIAKPLKPLRMTSIRITDGRTWMQTRGKIEQRVPRKNFGENKSILWVIPHVAICCFCYPGIKEYCISPNTTHGFVIKLLFLYPKYLFIIRHLFQVSCKFTCLLKQTCLLQSTLQWHLKSSAQRLRVLINTSPYQYWFTQTTSIDQLVFLAISHNCQWLKW